MNIILKTLNVIDAVSDNTHYKYMFTAYSAKQRQETDHNMFFVSVVFILNILIDF